MKRLVVLAFFVASLANVTNAKSKSPTVYGRINKALTFADQDLKTNDNNDHRSMTGALDVSNAVSHVGVMGGYDFDGLMADYMVDIGYDSSKDTIKIREVMASFTDFWGQVKLGHTYAASAQVHKDIDPLYETTISLRGISQAGFPIANLQSNIGYWYRGRTDLVSYTTPDFHGLQLSASMDKSDSQSLANKTNRDNFDVLAKYGMDMGDMGFRLYAGYTKAMGQYTMSGTTYTKDTSMLFGGAFEFADFTLSAMYQNRKKEDNGTTTKTEPEDTWMTFAAKYAIGKNYVALTYGKHEMDTNATKSATDKSDDSQIGLGYVHHLNKYVSLNALAAIVKHKEDRPSTSTASNDQKDNEAKLFSLGTTITF